VLKLVEVSTQVDIDEIYRREGSRVLATLIRLLGDFDLAEDAMLAAFAVAVEQWPRDGIPANPRAWLVSTGRFKTIDAIRRETRLFASLRAAANPETEFFPPYVETESIDDDRLRLVYICCHPALSYEGQIALTLRDVCGLSTEEIASAFLTSTSTIAQRIVRAKAKIREERVPLELPPLSELSARTETVLKVIYLLFNEGYYASSGETLARQVLSDEAIRLGGLLAELLPEPEVFGLLALMLLHESRRAARTSEAGDLILLPDQDKSLWNYEMIAEGLSLVKRSFESSTPGLYALQASIAAIHVQGLLRGETDWDQIASLYESILRRGPSAVVELNRAVAISMRDGPAAGLAIVDRLLAGDELIEYGLAHATRADLCRRLGRFEQAGESYTRAIELSTQASERRFLMARLQEVCQSQNRARKISIFSGELSISLITGD
jgi:RNA polymerase sigma-70 factor (ECF subfamily)